jgi:hypothetical protein
MSKEEKDQFHHSSSSLVDLWTNELKQKKDASAAGGAVVAVDAFQRITTGLVPKEIQSRNF